MGNLKIEDGNLHGGEVVTMKIYYVYID